MDYTDIGKLPTCPYCGGRAHDPRACPMVYEIEFYPDGTIKRVVKR